MFGSTFRAGRRSVAFGVEHRRVSNGRSSDKWVIHEIGKGRGMKRLVVIAILVAGCSSGGPRITDPPPVVTPPPTPPPWALAVGAVKYPTTVSLGDTFVVTIPMTNHGSTANPMTKLQFSSFDNAELSGCSPTCSVSHLLGLYASLPGVPASGAKSYAVKFVATKLGVMGWGLCVYDNDPYGVQVWCGNATTTVTR